VASAAGIVHARAAGSPRNPEIWRVGRCIDVIPSGKSGLWASSSWVGALLAGGVIAAPIAAWLVRKLPARILGSAVGSIILVTNAKTIVDAAGLAETAAVLAYTAIGLIAAFLLARAVVTLRRDGQSAAATA
jgi:hypothetical protein